MRPFKSGKSFANWLLRFALVISVYVLYANTIFSMAFKSLTVITASVLFLFSLLVIVGGFLTKPWLTVISGVIVVLLSLYKMFISFNGTIDHFVVSQFIPFAIGFYFFTNGNDH